MQTNNNTFLSHKQLALVRISAVPLTAVYPVSLVLPVSQPVSLESEKSLTENTSFTCLTKCCPYQNTLSTAKQK